MQRAYEAWSNEDGLSTEFDAGTSPYIDGDHMSRHEFHYKLLVNICQKRDMYLREYGADFLRSMLMRLEENGITGMFYVTPRQGQASIQDEDRAVVEGCFAGEHFAAFKDKHGITHADREISNTSLMFSMPSPDKT